MGFFTVFAQNHIARDFQRAPAPTTTPGGGPGEGVWGILETWGGSLGGFRGVWVQGAGEGCVGAVGVVLGCWGGFGGRGQGLAHL